MRRDSLASDGRRRGASLEINWDACLKASESEAATVMKSFTLKPSPFWGYRPTSSVTEAHPIFVSEVLRGCIARRRRSKKLISCGRKIRTRDLPLCKIREFSFNCRKYRFRLFSGVRGQVPKIFHFAEIPAEDFANGAFVILQAGRSKRGFQAV